MAEPIVVAVRTGDSVLAEQVAQVVGWWEGRLVVRPPGAPPPPADVHVDSALERAPGDPPWARGHGIVVVRSDQVGGGGDAAAQGALAHAITLPERAGDLADAIAIALAARSSRTIGVLAARGGAGASVTAAMLARMLAERGRSAALVDLVGGLEHLLALEDEPGPRWADLEEQSAPFVGSHLAGLLPTWAGVPVLGIDSRGGPGAVGPVLAALHESVSTVVLDAGRCRPPVVCETLLVVATPEPAGVLGARELIADAATAGSPDIRLVLRRVPGIDVDPREVEDACGAPLVGVLPHARLLISDLARGVTPGDRRRSRLVRTMRTLAEALVP
ncbi:hypothetical protein [Salana multivorans]